MAVPIQLWLLLSIQSSLAGADTVVTVLTLHRSGSQRLQGFVRARPARKDRVNQVDATVQRTFQSVPTEFRVFENAEVSSKQVGAGRSRWVKMVVNDTERQETRIRTEFCIHQHGPLSFLTARVESHFEPALAKNAAHAGLACSGVRRRLCWPATQCTCPAVEENTTAPETEQMREFPLSDREDC